MRYATIPTDSYTEEAREDSVMRGLAITSLGTLAGPDVTFLKILGRPRDAAFWADNHGASIVDPVDPGEALRESQAAVQAQGGPAA